MNMAKDTLTATVYTSISNGDFAKAIRLLETKLADFPRSRPLLSLMAYCCYHHGEFARAAEFYERCHELCPASEEYRVFYVQSLVQGGSHSDASRAAAAAAPRLTSPKSRARMKLLQAHAELEQGMLSACATTLKEYEQDDPATIIALATLDFREGRFAKALETYKIASLMGDMPMLRYCIALCHYRLGDCEAALGIVDEMVGEQDEEQTGSHGTQWQEHTNNRSFLAEALNLKAAISYSKKQFDSSKDSAARLCDLQQNENLDAIAIHNDALLNIEEDPSIGIQKLEFLLSDGPPETLNNLLACYMSHGQGERTAETFTAHRQLAQERLLPEVYAYFDAVVMSLTCPDDALSMLEAQVSRRAETMRAGKVDAAHATRSVPTRAASFRLRAGALAVATREREAAVDDAYLPALLLQARLCWDRREYPRAARLLRRGADFCRERDAWRLNMGHVAFAQAATDKTFDAAIEHYELLVRDKADADLLEVPAVALANLCVAYIMTNRNDEAEDLIKAVEREEHREVALGNRERAHHTCIVNLVIGTLYCERGNFEFGVGRICKSLGTSKGNNLFPDTWFYAKRCFLALASKLSKVMCTVTDDTLREILRFLEDVQENGSDIPTEDEVARSELSNAKEPATIASEAWQLKNTFINICA